MGYQKVLVAERQLPYRYSYFLFAREDSVFLHNLQFADLKCDLNAAGCFVSDSSNATNDPAVAVDEQCGFGAYSDKVYFANSAGARVLFSESLEVFVRKMTMYILGAMFL